jgi:NAD+ diphosphatase
VPEPEPGAVAFPFLDGQLLLPERWQAGELPAWIDVRGRELVGPHDAGVFRGRPAVALTVEETPPGYTALPLRRMLMTGPADLASAAALASQVNEWANAHRFCGRCGTPTVWRPQEPRAMTCPSCGALHFARINPAVITVVHRGDEILLAHNRSMAAGYFALIAGFVEPGETMEETVRREIREEVKLEVGDPVYQSSQPWPFPSQLMAGFFAPYRSGEIQVDDVEIGEAAWFHRDHLPDTSHRPPPYTIAGRLIGRWLETGRVSAGSH